jgi:hypothetical protein
MDSFGAALLFLVSRAFRPGWDCESFCCLRSTFKAQLPKTSHSDEAGEIHALKLSWPAEVSPYGKGGNGGSPFSREPG